MMTDTPAPATGSGTSAAAAAVQQLRAQRDEALRELARLTEQDCRYPAPWGGVTRTVNFMLRAFSLHDLDHLQHAQRLLRGRGADLGEAQLLLMKAQALRGELEALVLGLTDEQFEAAGPDDEWSIRQLVDHVRQTDRGYFETTRKAVAEGRASAG